MGIKIRIKWIIIVIVIGFLRSFRDMCLCTIIIIGSIISRCRITNLDSKGPIRIKINIIIIFHNNSSNIDNNKDINSSFSSSSFIINSNNYSSNNNKGWITIVIRANKEI